MIVLSPYQLALLEAARDDMQVLDPQRVTTPAPRGAGKSFAEELAATGADFDALLAGMRPRVLDDPYAPREDNCGPELLVPDPYPVEDTWDVNEGEDFRDLSAYEDAREGVL